MQTIMEKGSDKQLREAVLLRQFEWEPEIQSQDISVNAKEGVATLTGFVHSYAEKVAAEKAAKSVYGVKAVANDTEVKPMTRTDSAAGDQMKERINAAGRTLTKLEGAQHPPSPWQATAMDRRP